MKIKATKEKGLGLPPKKHSFKVKSLTVLLCLIRISQCMNISFLNRLSHNIWFNHCSLNVNVPLDSLHI